MPFLTLSAVIAAIEPEQQPMQDQCLVFQQQDTEKTAPCSGAGGALNMLLSMIGIKVPPTEDTETYSTSISVKPKNPYTSLNISFTHGVPTDPIYSTDVINGRVRVSISDFVAGDDAYYTDVRDRLNLVDGDNIMSVSWGSPPVDGNLKEISPRPSISVTTDDRIRSSSPADGVLVVKYNTTTINHEVDIPPRVGVSSNFYESYVVIEADGCSDKPFFYKIEVPSCYERNQRIRSLIEGLEESGGDAELGPPPNPRGGRNTPAIIVCVPLISNMRATEVPALARGRKKATGASLVNSTRIVDHAFDWIVFCYYSS